MQIIRVENIDEVYKHYDGKKDPQETFVELDPEKETLRAAHDSKSEVPIKLSRQRVVRWKLGTIPMPRAANRLLEQILPLSKEIVAGYSIAEMDRAGTGVYTEDAKFVIESVQDVIDEWRKGLDDEEIVTEIWIGRFLEKVVKRGAEFEVCFPESKHVFVKSGMSDEEVRELADLLRMGVEEHRKPNVVVFGSAYHYLLGERDKM